MENKLRRLFLVLSGFFITNALLAEFIGVKLFSLEQTFGYDPVNWKILGIENLSFNLTAGVLLWPFVFVLTDIINEYFGKRGVQLLSYLTSGLIAYAFLMIMVAMHVKPADFWIVRQIGEGAGATQVNMDTSFNAIFGQGMWIIIASLTAFLVSQVVDVYVFHYLRKITGHKKIWLRATGSTIISQLIDSFVVLYIAFHIGGPGWPMKQIFAIMIINYIYKVFMALAMTPVIYLVHYAIDGYLGTRLSNKITEAAAKNKA
jgi:uncharacterized integral membrane protein (TIGR00697 family)